MTSSRFQAPGAVNADSATVTTGPPAASILLRRPSAKKRQSDYRATRMAPRRLLCRQRLRRRAVERTDPEHSSVARIGRNHREQTPIRRQREMRRQRDGQLTRRQNSAVEDGVFVGRPAEIEKAVNPSATKHNTVVATSQKQVRFPVPATTTARGQRRSAALPAQRPDR